jgi:hypothetical protein
MKSIKVRFNLSRGKNYMKWKVEYPDNKKEYLDPSEVQLIMTGCFVKNHKKTAEKIYSGEHKTVCAWVLCENITVSKPHMYDKETKIPLRYNPRVTPNWIYDGNLGPVNVDGCPFREIISDGKNLFVTQL